LNTSDNEFATLGLSSDDWTAFILGRGTLPAQKLDAARVAVARLGRYTEKQASDTEVTDSALRQIATRYPYLWLRGETLTVEDKIRFLEASRACSREEAEKHLEADDKDRAEEAQNFGKGE
jgi:hypothetical protein